MEVTGRVALGDEVRLVSHITDSGFEQDCLSRAYCELQSQSDGLLRLWYPSKVVKTRNCNRVFCAFLLFMALGLFPPLSHAQLSYWMPCSGSEAKAEGRTVDIRRYVNAKTIGMKVGDIEDLYCVTRVKCIVLGHCTAASPEEQAAADKLKQQIAAEEARLQKQRQAKAAEAEAQRKKAEEDIRQKERAAAAEKARRDELANAEAKRLGVTKRDAKRLVEAREEARRKMPPQPEKCTFNYPAYERKLDFTPGLSLHSVAQKDYAALDRGQVCNGHPGSLDPLQCTQPINVFGASFASCTATLRCPARQESHSCNRATAQ